MTLVDTNVLLDLVTDDPHWVAIAGALAINDVANAELSVRYQTIKVFDATLAALRARLEAIPTPVCCWLPRHLADTA
ncbi:hypothetical protein [Bradyrhizobium sp.]|uniref:hypothetical protein n=1 Tax=Bradyrhizobium sp. TaxID=376 RepID=UPI002DFB5425|nr:hypothetical protein [Bradyrhizobium sp.]